MIATGNQKLSSLPSGEWARRSIAFILPVLLSVAFTNSAGAQQDAEQLEFFEKRIRPVLISQCYACHSAAAKEVKGGLRLDSRAGIRKGGDSGPAVVPGNVDQSHLISAIKHDGFEMPPGKKFRDYTIRNFETWIKAGAVDPRDKPPSAFEASEIAWQLVYKERRNWWSLHAVKRPAVPMPQNRGWSDRPIDRFILSRLEKEKLTTGQPADPHTLVRRLWLVLIGLPPTPEETARFVNAVQNDPKRGTEEAVDYLLASPHFGERWARHWMDVVRFAETHGYEWNHEIRDAWRYRDYLIRAFNDDVPYDQFVREHIAGDLIENRRTNRELQLNESIIGTAFWRFGELGHDNCVRFPEIRFDALDNQIDTLTKAFQASTVACARCHDHKLDAISTRDYYALVGVLESSRHVIRTIDLPQRFSKQRLRMRELKENIRRSMAKRWLDSLPEIRKSIAQALVGKASALLQDRMNKDGLAPDDPAFVLRRLASSESPPTQAMWDQLASELQEDQAARTASNAGFESWPLYVDENAASTWRFDGPGPTRYRSRSGDFTVAQNGEAAFSELLPMGMYSNLFSSRLSGTAQSPWIPTHRKFVSIRFRGGGLSLIRAVIDSCTLNEFAGGGFTYLDDDQLRWMTFPTSEPGGHRSFLELTTKSDNVRWPDRPDRAGTKDEKKLRDPRSWFGVTDVVLHDGTGTPKPGLSHVLALFRDAGDDDDAAIVDRIADRFTNVIGQAIGDWKADRVTADGLRWLNWALSVGLVSASTSSDDELSQLVTAYREVESSIPVPRVVAGMADHGAGVDSPVLLRGNPQTPGPVQPRGYLRVLAAMTSRGESGDPVGSGRLQLASQIASADNPLTARVMVNRIWHHVFGAGLVRTTDDFGHLGERPSHPELLDYLADEFVRDGWSIKRLIRRLALSKTFQQSAASTESATTIDPDNRLLHHYPVRRLDAEAIRDSILAVSGRLDRTMYGPSIHPWRKEAKEHRKLYIGPLDGNGRRSLYLKVTRMEGPRFLELFDLPDQMATRGRRDRTSVPAQALAMLNDPFLLQQANEWSGRLIKREDETIDERIRFVIRKALARDASESERRRLTAFVQKLAALQNVADKDVLSSRPVWKDVAHAVFNLKELIYVR